MNISVIIPVYNAERHLVLAVESALNQAETAEVILVEDKSPDNCLELCQQLEAKHSKVRLVRHADGGNHGAGVSRNLGVTEAENDYIAFLDADDYFLDNRFSKVKERLEANPEADGVYEAIGCDFENDEAKRRYFDARREEITTITKSIKPNELFRYLVMGGAGYIHLNGLVVRKKSILDAGLFPALRLHQDMVFCIKLAAVSKLVAGETKIPVGLRHIHLENRITNPKNDFTVTMHKAYEDLYQWVCQKKVIPNEYKALIKKKHLMLSYRFYKKERRFILACINYAYYRLLCIADLLFSAR